MIGSLAFDGAAGMPGHRCFGPDATVSDYPLRAVGLDGEVVIRPAYRRELARSSSRSAANAGEGWCRLG
jgi:hypothetical protein